MKLTRTVIPAKDVLSLTWCGDTLVDWVSGDTTFYLDGRMKKSSFYWPYRFDAAQTTEDGRWTVVYRRAGTKALLLRDRRLVRELNRSYYHAEVYEYPICIWNAADGRTLIAHCPDEYNRIEIEDAETGERLTAAERKPTDIFHSRLSVNRSGTRLLSAGWLWHPVNVVVYFDIAMCLRDPRFLDDHKGTAPGIFDVAAAEVGSACWKSDDEILLGATSEPEDASDEDLAQLGEPRLHPRGIAVYDIASARYSKAAVLADGMSGTMMPVGNAHAVCFYQHPKIVSLDTGQVLERWEDLDTGAQNGSIIYDSKIPPLAIDAKRQRFAALGPGGIHVVQFESTQ